MPAASPPMRGRAQSAESFGHNGRRAAGLPLDRRRTPRGSTSRETKQAATPRRQCDGGPIGLYVRNREAKKAEATTTEIDQAVGGTRPQFIRATPDGKRPTSSPQPPRPRLTPTPAPTLPLAKRKAKRENRAASPARRRAGKEPTGPVHGLRVEGFWSPTTSPTSTSSPKQLVAGKGTQGGAEPLRAAGGQIDSSPMWTVTSSDP